MLTKKYPCLLCVSENYYNPGAQQARDIFLCEQQNEMYTASEQAAFCFLPKKAKLLLPGVQFMGFLAPGSFLTPSGFKFKFSAHSLA